MACTPIPGGFACGPRNRRKRCTSCGRLGDLECDYPVGRPDPKIVRVGDARVHRVMRCVFYVHKVQSLAFEGEPDGAVALTVGKRAPSFKADRQVLVSQAKWFEATAATCDRAICGACVARVVTRHGKLDFCPPHGREYAKALAKLKEASEG